MVDMIRGPSALLSATKAQSAPTPRSAGRKIASSFQQMFDEVNRDKLQADKMVTEMVAGRNKDIAGTVIAMEKASVSTQMLLAVRNKVVNAYEEIMRMPV